ncbi:MAG: PAS domain S-box protein [Bacteroidales bacterium]|nr:PAS domain S-box protein [Bacteroidales bacterium]
MKNKSHRELIAQAILYSFVLSVFLFLIALFSKYISNDTESINLLSALKFYREDPLLWLISGAIVLIPLSAFFLFSYHIGKIEKKDKIIEKDNEKSEAVNDFITHLIRDDFSVQYSLNDEDDKIGKLLIKLRDTLATNREIVEKRRKEDEIRNWTAEGMAKFGEILRMDNDNLERLAYNVIKNLTDYIDGIQGGFYFLQTDKNEEKYFDLKAFYAYGRKKYADNRIKWGKGIIGTSAIERKSIYLTELPDAYINITSGLGQANPRSILISPLIANEELFGVIEIASLNEIEQFQIDFVEKVAESSASILSTVNMNMQTARLLEESKSQAQTRAAQEEEMRQNMEELQATQEEAARQADRFLKLETTVNHTMLRAEYNTKGTLIYANTRFLQKLEYTSNSEVEGKHILMFVSNKDEDWFKRIWGNLSKGGRHFEGDMKHITKNGKDLWTMATYTCIRDEEGEVERILFLGLDTTEQKKLSLKLEGIVDAVNRASIKIVFDINGNIKDFNEPFMYLFKYTEKEIDRLAVFDLIDPLELELFNKKWENIVRGMNFQEQFKVKTKAEEEKWIRGTFSAVYNMYNEVDSVVYIGTDTTNEKLMEIESKHQNEILKKQEKLLRESEKELSRKLKEARMEMKEQFKEIENIKIRNERTLEGALDAIITTSNDNKIIFFNKAAVNLVGYSKEEVLNQDISMLFDTENSAEDEFLSSYIARGDNKMIGVRKEVKMKTKDGEEIPVLILLSKAQVEGENTYTAFIQTIEVELF